MEIANLRVLGVTGRTCSKPTKHTTLFFTRKFGQPKASLFLAPFVANPWAKVLTHELILSIITCQTLGLKSAVAQKIQSLTAPKKGQFG